MVSIERLEETGWLLKTGQSDMVSDGELNFAANRAGNQLRSQLKYYQHFPTEVAQTRQKLNRKEHCCRTGRAAKKKPGHGPDYAVK